MNSDGVALLSLRDDPRYKILQELWRMQVEEIQKSRDKAAGRGHESAWRYWAGQEKGYALAITTLDRAIMDMGASEEKSEAQTEIEQMLIEINEIRGDRK